MQLREWQTTFQNVVRGSMCIDDLPIHNRSGKNTGISREQSIGIYANAYRERLHEALRGNFPALHQLLGDCDFAEMAYAFTINYPPQTASIRWFGAELTNYLRTTMPFSSCPAISELAQFEWALRHTVDAGDGERIESNYLQSLDAEQWRVFTCAVHPSLTIFRFDWNTPQVWLALDRGEEPPQPTQCDSCWFVYRSVDLTTQWRSTDFHEAEAIQQWECGENFGAICEFLEKNIGNEASAITTAASYMRMWVEQGLLVYSQQEQKNNDRNY